MELSGELFLFSSFNQVMPQIGRSPVVSTIGQRLSSHLSTGCAGQQLALSAHSLQTLRTFHKNCPLQGKELWEYLASQLLKI